MSFTRTLSLAPLALLLTGPAGCFLVSGDDLNNVEMREALDEVVLEGQGQAVENSAGFYEFLLDPVLIVSPENGVLIRDFHE